MPTSAVAHLVLVRLWSAYREGNVSQKGFPRKLLQVLPAVFTSRIPQTLPEPATAVVFRDDVVTGRVAQKALERVGSDFGSSLVFAGPDFTQEACDFASARGIFLVAATQDGGYFWSDQSLAQIHTDVGSHRPLRPPPANE